MKNYWDMLNLPPTASPEQIETQYEFLMHIYHPDYFTDPLDKMYAKRKCRALTAAYQALLANEHSRHKRPNLVMPPKVEPSLINWGIVHQGAQLSAQVCIYPGSNTQTVRLTMPGNAAWLVMERSGPIPVANAEPLLFEVVANTEGLTVDNRYTQQIQVDISTITLYIFLAVQIAPPCLSALTAAPQFFWPTLYAHNFHP